MDVLRRIFQLWPLLGVPVAFFLVLNLAHSGGVNSYLLGLTSFALMGALGEALGEKVRLGSYPALREIMVSALLWGGQGLALALGFWLVNGGVVMAQSAGILPGGGFSSTQNAWFRYFSSFVFTEPFFTSLFVNLGLISPLMFLQRFLRVSLNLRLRKFRRPTWDEIMYLADWPGFIKFELLSLFVFRLPFLTVVFMLPSSFWLPLAAGSALVCAGLAQPLKKSS